jgi:uncharacterized Zn finger protein
MVAARNVWAERWARQVGDCGAAANLGRLSALLRGARMHGAPGWRLVTLEIQPGSVAGAVQLAGAENPDVANAEASAIAVSGVLPPLTARERLRLTAAFIASAAPYIALLQGRLVATLEAVASDAHIPLVVAPTRWTCACGTRARRRGRRCSHLAALSQGVADAIARDPQTLLRLRGLEVGVLIDDLWRTWAAAEEPVQDPVQEPVQSRVVETSMRGKRH